MYEGGDSMLMYINFVFEVGMNSPEEVLNVEDSKREKADIFDNDFASFRLSGLVPVE